nr:hypothetical protein [Tanacetum cinerariifolium]
MATTIEQQTALDESLVPSSQRLRIGRCNFRLPSDIQSKEATLQVVYDVLRNSPLFRAFQVTADVPDIYMQEFWATAKLHHHSIRFKIDIMKSVLDLEAFREIVVSRHQATQQYGAILPIELTNNEIRNSKAYQEYHACAMGEAAPKPKASARKKKGEFASSTTTPTPTPTTTAESAPRLSASAKGKRPLSATTPVEPTDLQRTEAEQLKLYMDQQLKEAVREVVQQKTDQLQDSLQRENDEFLRNIDENMKNVLKGLVKTQVKEQVSRILPRVEESVNATLEAEVLTRSSHSSRTSYAVAADLSEMELKKILIEKMEGNRSIQRSDEQRNLSKALVEAHEADKAILDTYGESTILKRRREDDDQEGPSAGPNRGQSAQAEEPVQTTCQIEETPLPVYETGADDQPIIQTSQHPEWFSQPRKPPSPDRSWNVALAAAQGNTQSWISELAKQADARSSFNELLDTPIDFSNFIMHRLNVDTLTPDLLAGPTYELMKGSCSTAIQFQAEYANMNFESLFE